MEEEQKLWWQKGVDFAMLPADYLKEKIDLAIRERAILALKAELTIRKKGLKTIVTKS